MDAYTSLRAGSSASALSITEWRLDRRMGVISLCMWGGTAVKVFSLLSFWEQVQCLVGMALMFALVVAWPSFALKSYMTWRVPVLSFLRVGLIALPFNFSTSVFDAIAPHVDTGPFAIVSNVFNLFMAMRVALLTFTCLGWRVPFRLHLVLHTINVWIFIQFGLEPYGRSKLLGSPEMGATIAAIHKAMADCASVVMPSTTILVPQGPTGQCAAFLLICWAICGWLLPTLLLLPEAALKQQQVPQPQQPPGVLQQVADKQFIPLEKGLCLLLLPAQAARVASGLEGHSGPAGGQAEQQLYDVALFPLYWGVVLMLTWWVACSLAGDLQPAALVFGKAGGLTGARLQ